MRVLAGPCRLTGTIIPQAAGPDVSCVYNYPRFMYIRSAPTHRVLVLALSLPSHCLCPRTCPPDVTSGPLSPRSALPRTPPPQPVSPTPNLPQKIPATALQDS